MNDLELLKRCRRVVGALVVEIDRGPRAELALANSLLADLSTRINVLEVAPSKITRVIIESPYAGVAAPGSSERALLVGRNLRYLRACLRDCLLRGEAPFASHGLYTLPDVLNDESAFERELGMNAGFEWRPTAHLTAVYLDLGISPGMHLGIDHATSIGQHIEQRRLGGEWTAP